MPTSTEAPRPLRCALLGCGHGAVHLHLPVLRGLPEIELAALAEPDPERRAAAVDLVPGARGHASYEEAIEAGDIDAVVVALPNPLHGPAARAAFERGLHVYLEKPIATSVEEARTVVAAWRESGRVGMAGLNYRFGPLQQRARSELAAGRIGRVVAAQTVFSTPVRELPEWKRQRATGGGALLDLAMHHLDLACWLLDESPAAISCALRSDRSEDDTATVQLTLDDGRTVQILAALSAVDADRIEVYGTEGRMVVDRYRSDRLEVHPPSLAGVRLRRLVHAAGALTSPAYWARKVTRRSPEPSYWRALAAFAGAARTGREVSPDLLDGLRSLWLVESAEEAAATHRTVLLDGTRPAELAG